MPSIAAAANPTIGDATSAPSAYVATSVSRPNAIDVMLMPTSASPVSINPTLARGWEHRLAHVRRVEVAHLAGELQVVDRIAADIGRVVAAPGPVGRDRRRRRSDGRLHGRKPSRMFVRPVGFEKGVKAQKRGVEQDAGEQRQRQPASATAMKPRWIVYFLSLNPSPRTNRSSSDIECPRTDGYSTHHRLRSTGSVRARRRRVPRSRACSSSCARTAIRPSSSAFRSSGIRSRKSSRTPSAWRLIDLSESQRRADRSRHRHEVSVVFRSPSEQGCVAHSSVPRRVRAVRDRVQRFLARRRGRRPEADADRAGHENARRVPPPVYECAEHGESAGEVQRADGTRRCTIRRRLPIVSAPDHTATTCCSSGGSSRSSAPIWRCAQCSTSIVRYVWWWLATARSARAPRSWRYRWAWRIASTLRDLWTRQGLIDLYKGALAVIYSPFDEDYGYVTLESFLAHKPVITTTDAGGPLEFVEHETNGFVCEPDRRGIGCRRQSACSRQASGRASRRRRIRARAPRHVGRRDREAGRSSECKSR